MELHERRDSFALVIMQFDHHLPSKPDTAPFPHEACTAKKVWLNAHSIEAPHVERRIDPLEIDRRREHFHLLHLIQHIGHSFLVRHNIRWTYVFPLCSNFSRLGRNISAALSPSLAELLQV